VWQPEIAKTPYFGDLVSLKVIDVDTPK